MEKIIFLFPYPLDSAPSQRFRFEQYLPALKKQYQVNLHAFIDHETWTSLYDSGRTIFKIKKIIACFWRRFKILPKIAKSDWVFIHREASHIGPPVFEWIIAKVLRKKIIYDFDDAIWLPNYSETNANFQRLKAYWKVKPIMRWSHKICAGNHFLADFAKQQNSQVEVFPTTIDLENQHNQQTNQDQDPVIIGWTGTHTTMHYLDDFFPVLDELIKTHNFVFRVITNKAPEISRGYLDYIPWNKESEIEDLAKINIGVMPLKEDIWSAGKCGFKALQYMACEIPTVLSPIGVNTTIVQNNENGILANSDSEWITELSRLIEDKQKRIQLGKAGKLTIEASYSAQTRTEQFIQLFK
ncbi:MAG: glycosyltransferase involved in cell wall biosynthesis [Lentimonas sp.]|jgi:glycosyltransferase involved in cell wall biosynthesis